MNRFCLVLMGILFSSAAFAAEITVSVAASLKDAFTEIARSYEQDYPRDTIKLNSAASGVLLRQIERGAPVDVFASADLQTLNQAEKQHLLQPKTRRVFAQNELVLIVPKNSTLNIKQLNDLQQNSVKRIVLGKPESVPAGAYTKTALEKAGLLNALNPRLIYAQNVRQALDYVVRGEVQAGFVYQTDAVLKRDSIRVIQKIKTPYPIVYPIAALSGSKHLTQSQRFIDYVVSPKGQSILKRYGFIQP